MAINEVLCLPELPYSSKLSRLKNFREWQAHCIEGVASSSILEDGITLESDLTASGKQKA